MTPPSLRDEVTGLLQELIRTDTVNPPGNETRADVLRRYLASNDIPCELFARVPERANLVARLPGGDGPSLAFLCHTDTCSPTRRSGSATRGRETSSTARCGARRARHEGSGRGERGRLRLALARRVPPRRPPLRRHRRRGGRRGFGLEWLVQEHRMRFAATTRSTKEAASGSCSAIGRSICVPWPRRCRPRFGCEFAAVAATRHSRTSRTTRSSRRRATSRPWAPSTRAAADSGGGAVPRAPARRRAVRRRRAGAGAAGAWRRSSSSRCSRRPCPRR